MQPQALNPNRPAVVVERQVVVVLQIEGGEEAREQAWHCFFSADVVAK
jgi:hypothetical protein